jgi:6-phosphogluconolactonase
MKPPEIVRSGNFARDAAVFIVEKARRAIAAHGLFRLGLAGGKTPAQVYEEVARLGAELPWERVQITFGDERCVPPDDPESNYLMAKSTLLDRISIREPNVFRIRGELGAEKAAREYEQKLAAVATRLGEARYVHDLLLLGLGRDGHTASLFPVHRS